MKMVRLAVILFIALLFGNPNFVIGQSQSPEIFTVVEETPSFVGGQAAMYQFLSKNLKYPEVALEANTQGTVYISFIVEVDGVISNATIKRDIGNGCGVEALRVVKLMPKWNPGKQKGKAVRTQFVLPVTFKLN